MSLPDDPHRLFEIIEGKSRNVTGTRALLVSQMKAIHDVALHGLAVTAPPSPPPPEPPPPAPPAPGSESLTVWEAGTVVSGRSLDVLEIRPPTTNAAETRIPRHITVTSCGMHLLYVTSATDVYVKGCSVGPAAHGVHPMIKSYAGQPVCNTITIEDTVFHDMSRDEDANPPQHTEGLQVGGGTNLVFRRCTFIRCAVMGLFLRGWTSAISNVLIEACDFYPPEPSGYYALRIAQEAGDPPVSGVRLRANRWHAGASWSIDPGVEVLEHSGDVRVP